jgi:four helix bundle protein
MDMLIPIVKAIPKGNRELVDQLKRASISLVLNIAEGAGKSAIDDKKRFYSIARGSTLECAAILDLLLPGVF